MLHGAWDLIGFAVAPMINTLALICWAQEIVSSAASPYARIGVATRVFPLNREIICSFRAPSIARPDESRTLSALPEFLHRIAKIERDFIVYDDGWRGWTYSYSDVARMAGALVARFRSSAVGKSDYVLICLESRAGWIGALWACLFEGVILVPVELQVSLALLRCIERECQPRLVLLGDLTHV